MDWKKGEGTEVKLVQKERELILVEGEGGRERVLVKVELHLVVGKK